MNGSHKPKESGLWTHINQTHVTKEQIRDLANFKSSPVNFKIALWNPHTNGVRYVKALIYLLCTQMTPVDWTRITKIKNRSLGNPLSVKYKGEEICLDYLQAVFELEFIASNATLDGSTILEIGAGYGRTCHAIVSNHNLKAYHIVDLENCLELSKNYLAQVLDQNDFSKIRFISANEFSQLEANQYDLCINIDSFAEMDAEVVRSYLDYIAEHSRLFYVKNPVGKYLDGSLDDNAQGEVVEMALSTGLLRDVLDIHDDQAVATQSVKFVDAYQPGDRWHCVKNSWARPWSYYWQAMYKSEAVKGARQQK